MNKRAGECLVIAAQVVNDSPRKPTGVLLGRERDLQAMLTLLEFSILHCKRSQTRSRWPSPPLLWPHGSLPLCFASFIVNSVKFIFLSYIISSQGIINALSGQHAIIIPFGISGILYGKMKGEVVGELGLGLWRTS